MTRTGGISCIFYSYYFCLNAYLEGSTVQNYCRTFNSYRIVCVCVYTFFFFFCIYFVVCETICPVVVRSIKYDYFLKRCFIWWSSMSWWFVLREAKG